MRACSPGDRPQGRGHCFDLVLLGGRLAPMARRFVPLTEVSEVLGVSAAQTYALVRSGELPAIKVGGRGQWRVEVDQLDAYIERMYAQTREFVQRGGAED